MNSTRISEFSAKWYMIAFTAAILSKCFLHSLSSGLKRKTTNKRMESSWWEYKIHYWNQSQYYGNTYIKETRDCSMWMQHPFYTFTTSFRFNSIVLSILQYLYDVWMIQMDMIVKESVEWNCQLCFEHRIYTSLIERISNIL